AEGGGGGEGGGREGRGGGGGGGRAGAPTGMGEPGETRRQLAHPPLAEGGPQVDDQGEERHAQMKRTTHGQRAYSPGPPRRKPRGFRRSVFAWARRRIVSRAGETRRRRAAGRGRRSRARRGW